MKQLFDTISRKSASVVTKTYSTSFSIAVRLLDSSIRQDVYNIYGFVRVADEIVDSFEGYNQKALLDAFERDYKLAMEHRISTNPILHAFQETIYKYNIDQELVEAFLSSMRADLDKKVYETKEEIEQYIYGSADVVGLMCLHVFVKGDKAKYIKLKDSAMRLGSAFQKVNFLRDLKKDYEDLNRAYFPDYEPNKFDESQKKEIILDIKQDFQLAYEGIKELPREARLGVFIAYKYYSRLLSKIDTTPATTLKEKRIRVSNPSKMYLLLEAYMGNKLMMV